MIKSSLQKSSGINIIGNLFRLLASYVTILLAAKLMDIESFGNFNLLYTYTYFFAFVLTLGFDNSLNYLVPKFLSENNLYLIKKLIYISFLVTAAASLLLLLSLFLFKSFLVDRIIPANQFDSFIILTSQTMLLAFISILNSFLRAEKLFTPVILADQFLFPLLKLIGLFMAVLLFADQTLGYSISHLIAAIVVFLYLGKDTFKILSQHHSKNDTSPRLSLKVVKSWVTFSIPLGVSSSLEPFLAALTIMLYGLYASATDMAIFVLNTKIIYLSQFLAAALIPFFAPYLAESYLQNNTEKFKVLYQNLNLLSLKWSLTFIIFVLMTSSTLLSMFGADFVPGKTSLMILCIGGLAEGTFRSIRMAYAMTGFNRSDVYNYIIAIGINIVTAAILIPRYGIIGASISYSSTYVTLAVCRLFSFSYLSKVNAFSLKQILFVPITIILSSAFYFVLQNMALSSRHMLVLSSIYCSILGLVLFRLEILTFTSSYFKKNT